MHRLANAVSFIVTGRHMLHEKFTMLLLGEAPACLDMLAGVLTAQGHTVGARITATSDLHSEVERSRPDLVIACLDAPGRAVLEALQAITRRWPLPIVMFTHDSDAATIELAIKCGVTAYIVDGLSPERILPVLDVATARFREYRLLHDELELTRMQLAERKLIDKAKGLLMKKGMDEDQAYHRLRKMAMDRNMKLPELARSIIAAAELLE